MIYLPLHMLQPGMVLAKDLPSDLFYFSLATKGHSLTEQSLRRITAHNVQGAYVELEGTDDVVSDELIEPAFKQELLREVRRQFDAFVSHTAACSGIYGSLASIAANLVESVLSHDDFLLNMIDIRDYDTYTYAHSMSVGLLSVLVGAKMQLPRDSLVQLAMSGLLHDMGKLEIPAHIINKPGRLTPEEYEIIKQHPSTAYERLRKDQRFSALALSGVATHHERFDGTGYPHGLKGKAIPLFGRILALTDTYDALTSVRSYRTAWPSARALDYMMSCADTYFDLEILQIFLSVITAYPNGTLISMSDGAVAVVTGNTPSHPLRPVVRILTPSARRGQEIDLATDLHHLNITVTNVVEKPELLGLESSRAGKQ